MSPNLTSATLIARAASTARTRQRARGGNLSTFAQAQQAAKYLLARTRLRPRIAVVLGSGLGAFADSLANPALIDYRNIPHFPVSTAIGHAGRLVIGTLQGVPAGTSSFLRRLLPRTGNLSHARACATGHPHRDTHQCRWRYLHRLSPRLLSA